MNRIKRKFNELLLIKDFPRKIALGFAIGVFYGVFPTFGIGLILAVITSALLRANKTAALIGSFAGFPVFNLLYTILSIVIGGFILGQSWEEIMVVVGSIRTSGYRDLMKYIFSSYSIGIIILSVITSVLAYLIGFYIVKSYQKKVSKSQVV